MLTAKRLPLFCALSLLAAASCSSDDSTQTGTPTTATGSGGQGGGTGTGTGSMTTGGAGGSGGGSTSTTTGSGGSSGGNGGSAGNAGSTGGQDASAGSSGAGGGDGGPTGKDAATDTSEGSVACPGAGKSLHFSDDVGGTNTLSMQVLADLGADLPIGNAARTIEMWLYMEGNESWKSEHSIVEYGGTGRCQAFGVDGGDNGPNNPAQFDPFTFSSGGPCSGDDNGNITPAPARTGWLHIAWSYDPLGTLAYLGQTGLNFLFTVNGVAQNIPAKTQTGALLTMRTMVYIGSGQNTNNGFTGKIDEFRFWNVARTAQEIADNYKVILKGDEPGLVAYYHFDDGMGTAPKDSSSKHHDAAFGTTNNRPVPTWVDSTGLTLTCKP